MKYYKRIAGEIAGYEIGKIYRDNGEDDIGGSFCSIKDSVDRNPRNWQEVTEQEYLKQNDMRFAVKVTPTTSRILQQLAFENGYSWNNSGRTSVHCETSKFLCFYPDQKVITHTDADKGHTISLEEAIERIESKPNIIIGGYNVEFLHNGNIKVGCQIIAGGDIRRLMNSIGSYNRFESITFDGHEVNKETLEQIYNRL